MTKLEICAAIQGLVRLAYPRVIVKPSTNEWNPYQDVLYKIFFVPDSAVGEEWYDYSGREGGWFDQADKMGIPRHVMWSPVSESDTKKHYAHLFPEVFGKSASAESKRGKSKPAAKRSKPRVSHSRAMAASK